MVTNMSWEQITPQSSENISQDNSIQQNEQNQSLSWGQFETPTTYQGTPDPTEDENTFEYLLRLGVSNTARGAESYAGRTGDIESFGRKMIPKEDTWIGKAMRALMPKGRWDEMVNMLEGKAAKPKEGGMNEGTLFPTSRHLKKFTEAATGDYTKPKTKTEAKFQELSGDIGSMGRGGGSVRRQLVNKVGIPAASNAAKETIEQLGFGETAGNWTKLASMLGLTLLNGVNAPAYAANLMNEGRQGFGANIVADIPRYQNEINNVSRNMLHGDPRSALAQQQLAGLNHDLQNGQTTMRDLMNRYDAINAAKRDRGLFQLNRTDRAAARRNINLVRDAVRREIEQLGHTNPQALESWQAGVRAFSVIHQSQALTNTAERFLGNKITQSAVGGLFGSAIYKAPLAVGSTASAAPIVYKAGQVAYRVWNDPNLASYYWNAMLNLSQENGAAFAKNFDKLEKAYEKKYGQD